MTIDIDGRLVVVREGTSVAVALLDAGRAAFRRSETGEPRGPICGMGVCFECRVTIDGESHRRACMVICRDGMEVVTDAAPPGGGRSWASGG